MTRGLMVCVAWAVLCSSLGTAHAKVLVFGHSHTRQIGQTLACQYADDVLRVDHLEPADSPDPNMAIRVTFTCMNNSF